MMIGCSHQGRRGSAFQTVTISPRLDYSAGLLSCIVGELRQKSSALRAANARLLDAGHDGAVLRDSIELERRVEFSLQAMLLIQQKMGSVSKISGIPKALTTVIFAVKSASAQLYGVMPACSQKLCELSVHLGSIVLDSAAISTAKFDFGQSNSESAVLLDKLNLIVDSKINKLYGNLGAPKESI